MPGCAGDDRPSRLPGFAQVAQRLAGRWPPPALLSEIRPVAPEPREALVPRSRVPGTDRVPGSNRGDRRRSRVAPRFFTSVPRDRMPKSEPGPSRPASGRPNGSPPHGRPRPPRGPYAPSPLRAPPGGSASVSASSRTSKRSPRRSAPCQNGGSSGPSNRCVDS